MNKNTEVLHLGQCQYLNVWQKMKDYTDTRDSSSADQLWLVEHPPVYTLGQAGKIEHLLRSTDIPLVKSDRGGQITYHGPGQIIIYTLYDLRRLGIGVRRFVVALEESVIELLASHSVSAVSRRDAPGVYVDNKKIAALGLRVRKGCTYHGLAVNIDMDLSPFHNINPCGYKGLEITQAKDFGISEDPAFLAKQLLGILQQRLQPVKG